MARLFIKLALAFLILAATGWLCRNWVFIYFISYKTDSVISTQLVENQQVAVFKPAASQSDSLIRSTLAETAAKLRFSFRNVASKPDEVEKTGRANCVGYSAFFKNLLEKKLAGLGVSPDFEIEHRRGRIPAILRVGELKVE